MGGVSAPARPARGGGGPAEPLAAVDPVAEVVVDVPLAHLDRPFEYAVPASMDGARAGTRVRVRFAGREVEAFVTARKAAAEHAGRLVPLRRLVSAEPVLDAAMIATCRAVADHYGGTLADVLRLAVPRRHAAAEDAGVLRALSDAPAAPADPPTAAWEPYPAGPALLARVRGGQAVRAVWTALPGPDPATAWPTALAQAAAAALAGGRGALVVVPDHRDLARVDAALARMLGPGHHVRLSADQGPSARYRAWLALRRGDVRVVVGTRAAMFAPVADLGLVAVWDDGDDNHVEPHAPHPHVREVLALRAVRDGAALIAGALARSVEAQRWVESGFAHPVAAPREAVRAAAPRVLLPGGDGEAERDPAAAAARLPSLAWRTAAAALDGALARRGLPAREAGPVLVQVPRRGYLLSLSCQRCRARARCARCAGPLQLVRADAAPTCRWCGVTDPRWACPACGGDRLRSVVVGARRTAEELGRAFPGTPVRRSGGGEVLGSVGPERALVVATPGAEPVAEGGYAAALLLDAWALLDRADLRASEEALRRWVAAAALVRGARAGGTVVLLAPAGLPPVEALVRWDPAGLAAAELAERTALRLPPAAAVVRISGAADGVAALLAHLELPDGAEVLGPVPLEAPPGPPPAPERAAAERPGGRSGGRWGGRSVEHVRAEPGAVAIVRAPPGRREALAAAVRAAQATRSARKEPAGVRVQLDPEELV